MCGKTILYSVSPKALAEYPDLCVQRSIPWSHFTQEYRPHISCSQHYGCCTCKTCFLHGHKERPRQSYKKWYFNYEASDTYYAVMMFDGWYDAYKLKAVKARVLAILRRTLLGPNYRKRKLELPYFLKTHWMHGGIAHFNIVFRLGLGTVTTEAVHATVKDCWSAALSEVGIRSTNPAHQRVSVRLAEVCR